MARLVAERIGGVYINSGDMYRTLAFLAVENGVDPVADPQAVAGLLAVNELEYVLDACGQPELRLNQRPVSQAAIRSPRIAQVVSFVARIPAVREWLRVRQRATVRLGRIVMEGRDIGTVIFPQTPHKFFLSASPDVRAARRLAQAGETADGATLPSVAAELAVRDRIDRTRAVAPLRPASDAVIIDTASLTAAQVADCIAAHVQGCARS